MREENRRENFSLFFFFEIKKVHVRNHRSKYVKGEIILPYARAYTTPKQPIILPV